MKAGSSYLAQHDLRVHFGLGAAKQIDRLEIRWPNGSAPEVLTGVAAGQIVTVTEGKGITARTPLQSRLPVVEAGFSPALRPPEGPAPTYVEKGPAV